MPVMKVGPGRALLYSGVVVPWYLSGGIEPANCIAAYKAIGAASLAASYLDLSGNGNDAFLGNAPGWDVVNGWVFDGIADYLKTTFVPANDQSQSLMVQFTGTANAGVAAGGGDGPNGYFGVRPDAGGATHRFYNGGIISPAGAHVAGNIAVAGAQGYINGAASGGAIGAWPGATVLSVFIGALNQGGVPNPLYQGNIQAVALYDCVLTPSQVVAVAAAMAAL